MSLKKYLLSLILLLTGMATGMAQDPQPVAVSPLATEFSDIMTQFLLAAIAILLVVVIVVVVRTNAFLTRHLLRLEAEKNGVQLPKEADGALAVEEDFFTRLRKKYWENPVPREREGEIMFHHAYDGIRELDNHLPPWWVNLFAITVIWGVGYMWYYHWGGEGPNQDQEYKTEVETAKKKIAMALAGKANAVDESSVTALTDAQALSDGELTFKSVCASCHGQKGEGLVGPNFTDEYWIHGGGIKNVFKTIKYGVPEKGMIAWSSQLKPLDIQKVSSYILTLKGTNPPNQKEPQGTIWTEEAAPAQDTTQTK